MGGNVRTAGDDKLSGLSVSEALVIVEGPVGAGDDDPVLLVLPAVLDAVGTEDEGDGEDCIV